MNIFYTGDISLSGSINGAFYHHGGGGYHVYVMAVVVVVVVMHFLPF